MFTDKQLDRIRDQTGVCDPSHLADRVRACGFDEHAYLTQNRDLQLAGFDPEAAFLHYLTHGYREGRDPVCGTLPRGLQAQSSLDIPDQHYASQLFQSLFFGQLRNPETADAMWTDIDSDVIGHIRRQRGIPYYIVGDSHVNHYVRSGWVDDQWLAPLPIVCHAASAIGLANDDAQLGYGRKILRWAGTAARFDVPIYLKFGGIDCEFLWMSRRIRDRRYKFSLPEFDQFAGESISRYGQFLDRLIAILGRTNLRVCSVFPSVMRDDCWVDGYIDAHRGSPENNNSLAAALKKVDVPDLRTRTELRRRYNRSLGALCREKDLRFIDDFNPLLGGDGILDSRYLGAHGGRDFHLDIAASKAVLTKIIQSSITPPSSSIEAGIT
jgi:hypothetical protein